MEKQIAKPILSPKKDLKKYERLNPIVGRVGKHKILNWNGYMVLTGYGKSGYILDEIQHRRKHVKQNMIIVVGAPGQGKSYFALRLSEVLDPDFDPNLQIVFERTHLLWLTGANSPLKMGQVILIDEAQFIAGARRWYEDIQKDIMEHMEAIRSKGYVVLIVALHINLLDSVIRKYVLSHMMKMRERGSAIVYHLWTPTFQEKLYRRRLGSMSLLLPSYEYCQHPSCSRCQFLETCMTNRAIYERKKIDFLGRMSHISEQKAAKREQSDKLVDIKDLIKKIVKQKDKIVYTAKGNPEPESIRVILEDEYGINISSASASRLVKRGKIKEPDVFKLQKPKDDDEDDDDI